jgi:lipoprotein NlpI
MQPTQTRAFGLRMLNNVKIQYSQAEYWSEILDIIECQLLVETVDQQAQAVLQFERGECLQQMSLPDQAQRAYMTCLALSPPAQIMLQAEQRLRDLKQPADRTLH